MPCSRCFELNSALSHARDTCHSGRDPSRTDNFSRVKVYLPDGTELELEDGATGAEAGRAIGEGLARAALAIKHDGQLKDLGAPLYDGAHIEIVTTKSEDALELIRHDTAHV